jgi:putative transposase
MRLTVKIKLTPSAEEHAALTKTLELCNKTANKLSQYAYETKTKRKYDLHYARYESVKATGLAAQAAVRTIAKVGDAYATQTALIKNGTLKGKRLQKAVSKPIKFRNTAAQAFDKNNLSYNFEKQTISIWTVGGRLRKVPFECSPEQLEQLVTCQKGESDLFFITAFSTSPLG